MSNLQQRGTGQCSTVCAAAVLCAALQAHPALAQDDSSKSAPGSINSYNASDYDLLPPTEAFRFNSSDEFYQKHRFSDDLRVKGVEIGDRIYFGEARVAGERGIGFVMKRGDFYWGVNYRGAELLFRF